MPQGRGPTAAARHLQTVRTFREVGLHQFPAERKGEGVPVRSLHVPSHVPSHPQTAAKVRGFSPTASGFTTETDWLLEEDGFELLVPLRVVEARLGPVAAAHLEDDAADAAPYCDLGPHAVRPESVDLAIF